mgnify:CR=1 FL=1
MHNGYDIVIIGAGLIGTNVAYQLARKDCKILVLEQTENAIPQYSSQGTTRILGRAMGSECSEYLDLLPITKKILDRLASGERKLYHKNNFYLIGEKNSEALNFFLDDCQERNIDYECTEDDKDSLGIVKSKQTLDFLKEENKYENDYISLLDVPITLNLLINNAKNNSVDFQFNYRVTQLSRDKNHIIVHTDKSIKIIRTKKLIICTNYQLDFLPELSRLIFLLNVPLLYYKMPCLCKDSFCFVEKDVTLGLFVIPKELQQPYYKVGMHRVSNNNSYEAITLSNSAKSQFNIKQEISEKFNSYMKMPFEYAGDSTCMYGVTEDGLPIIDEIYANIYLLAGFNGNGAKHSFAFAYLLRKWLETNKKPKMLSRFSMQRFSHYDTMKSTSLLR